MNEVNIEELLYGNNYRIEKVKKTDDKNIFYLKSQIKECECPCCHKISNNYHSTYIRQIQDTPIHCKETWLNVTTYEFYCDNPECPNKCFVEELPFARRYKKMTDSLIQLVLSVSMFLSCSCASLVLSFMGVKISADTINRMYNNLEIKDNPDVEKVGIDDVAIRKGKTYATAIYDLENHSMLALLEGRDAETLKKWLKEHKKITHVARDRASSYAVAINEILPDCIQIADRFHLFENLLNYLKDIFKEEIPQKIYIKNGVILDKAPKKVVKEMLKLDDEIKNLNYDNTVPTDEDGNIINYISKKRNIDNEQYQRQAQSRIERHNLVVQIRTRYNELTVKKCKKCKILSQEFGISLPTIRKYINMSDEEVENTLKITEYKDRKTYMDEYKNIIYKMLRDGYDRDTIFAYIVYRGYNKDYRILSTYIYLIGKNNFPDKTHTYQCYKKYVYEKDVIEISRCDLLKCILTVDPEKEKNQIIVNNLEIIKRKYPIVTEVETIFKSFHSIIMGNDENKLDDFINEYKDSKIHSFCESLKKDITPVKHAISYEISSGFVEGNNNKFKLIKRIVYGKMKLCNLFKKSYVTFLATKKDFNILDLL